MHFLTIKKFLFFFNWEILLKYFLDSYSENSWKHVVSSIIGEEKELLCPDGFMFEENQQGCDYPSKVNCGNRTILRRCKKGMVNLKPILTLKAHIAQRVQKYFYTFPEPLTIKLCNYVLHLTLISMSYESKNNARL